MNKKDKESLQYDEINNILDKMLEMKKSENKPNFVKRCILITTCIAIILLIITLCVMLYKNSFSVESLISLLLAFFSIFISVFFYFKADEASNRFYETSYNFMKDVSVTLGKIEERFGEKLNSLNDKISHLSIEKEAKKEELESAEDEKQAIIDDLMQKASLNDSQKQEYMQKLKIQDKQITDLQQELMRMRRMERNLRRERNLRVENDDYSDYLKFFNSSELSAIQNTHVSDWPSPLKEKLIKLNMLDSEGDLTPFGNKILMHILG